MQGGIRDKDGKAIYFDMPPDLHRQMKDMPKGTDVEITYLGWKKDEHNNMYQAFDVKIKGQG